MFVEIETNKEFLMDPRDIALSEKLIQEFDAVQAFYIGLFSGMKLNDKTMSDINEKKQLYPFLRIVK